MKISEFFITSREKPSRSTDRRTKSIGEVPHSIKFAYLNIRPRSYFATPPSTKIISNRPSTGNNLGPGKYKLYSHSPSPSFEFNRTPRFSNSEVSATILFKKLSDDYKEKINTRIEKNKEIAILSVSEKKKIAQKVSAKNEIRGKITRITKSLIMKEIKSKKDFLLKEKFQKFEYRMNIEVFYIKIVLQVRKSWVILNSVFSVATIVKKLVKNRKNLRQRSLKILILLKQISKCVGKIVIKLRRKRYLKSIRVSCK